MVQLLTGDLVARFGGELLGDGGIVLRRIAPLDTASADSIGFVANPKYTGQLAGCAAGCLIVAEAMRDAVASRPSAIVCADPYLYYARLSQWWAAQLRSPIAPGVDASAVVESGARVHASATIGALAYVGTGAAIGASVVVGAQCHVGAQARVGEHTQLLPRATLGEGCRIGARGRLHPGVVIGADGFGFAPHEGRWLKIEQLGAVDIGDDVDIGANSCIDRGALDDTRIGNGVKLDNLVQVGHNVRIGEHTAVAGCAGIAGSTHIGARCTIGGAARIAGHLTIADDVHIGGGASVTRSILKAGHYGGVFPLDDNGQWEKNAAVVRQLYALRGRVRALEKKTP